MSDTEALEIGVCRGHSENVSACLFHHYQDLILSVGGDGTICVWHRSKLTTVRSFKRDTTRFWANVSHPKRNLFATSHDTGAMVFKLEREGLASTLYRERLVYVTNKKDSYDFGKDVDMPPILSLRHKALPRTLSYNRATYAILLTYPNHPGTYELMSLTRNAKRADESTVISSDPAKTTSLPPLTVSPFSILLPSRWYERHVLWWHWTPALITHTTVTLFDVQQNKQLAEIAVGGVNNHNVTIATAALRRMSTLHENIRIKSASWDDSGVLIYSTLNHIKYSLLNGYVIALFVLSDIYANDLSTCGNDSGIVRAFDQHVYLVRVTGSNLYCLDCNAQPQILSINPAEYRFKLALVTKNHKMMLQAVKNTTLVGLSIISYIQKKGYPEIAMQCVRDPRTRFDLALECDNFKAAIVIARRIDDPSYWDRLGPQALAHGNHKTAEMTYRKQRNFKKLSFLYLATGNQEKLSRMAQMSKLRGDFVGRFQNAIYRGDVVDRIQLLKKVDQYRQNDFNEKAEPIHEASGLTEDQIVLPWFEMPLTVPHPIVPTFKSNRPVRTTDPSSFKKALVGWADSGDKAATDGFEVEGDMEAGLGKNFDEEVNACNREGDDISFGLLHDGNIESNDRHTMESKCTKASCPGVQCS
ncbi:coatomer subunit alpha [Penicillium subrubescens]|uniref:coatomer subunit alpha n=1 Tax=Penicillium subrubescens TaxID=1316194 RepID=UPI00254517AC|nr:coatomer subunit alpha [Penicillium subrubescens]KAJ5882803.1 coatomer subunit alpha [Penicillium subrubescens]